MKHAEITRAKLQSEVIRRAWESVQFKQKLLKEPKEALKEIGFPIHDEIEVVVVQEHKKKIVLVLPESPLKDLQEYRSSAIGPLSAGCPTPPTPNCVTGSPGCVHPTPLTDHCQETLDVCPKTPDCAPHTGSDCQPIDVTHNCQITVDACPKTIHGC